MLLVEEAPRLTSVKVTGFVDPGQNIANAEWKGVTRLIWIGWPTLFSLPVVGGHTVVVMLKHPGGVVDELLLPR